LETARALAGPGRVLFDDATTSVRFDRPGVTLDLGAIGKGYAVDAAVALLRQSGVASALLHGGTSSVAAIGAPPGADGWKVAVAHPTQPDAVVATVLLCDGETLSVSAPHGKAFSGPDGAMLGHVLDPRAGHPAEGSLLAAVACSSATEGDALSTALLVLGHNGLNHVARRRPEASAFVLATDGSLSSLGSRLSFDAAVRKD
jgi:thiamine biosynthesis lipoprotein